MAKKQQTDPLAAEEPRPGYFEYDPEAPPGVYDTPLLGEVEPGRVYEVRAHIAPIIEADAAFKKSSRAAFERQQDADAGDYADDDDQ